MQASGVVLSLLKLEDDGLAAGTDASTVDVLNVSAVSPDGLNEKYETLQASGDVLPLLKLEDGGLVADIASEWRCPFHC